jgi:hypothetical protein
MQVSCQIMWLSCICKNNKYLWFVLGSHQYSLSTVFPSDPSMAQAWPNLFVLWFFLSLSRNSHSVQVAYCDCHIASCYFLATFTHHLLYNLHCNFYGLYSNPTALSHNINDGANLPTSLAENGCPPPYLQLWTQPTLIADHGFNPQAVHWHLGSSTHHHCYEQLRTPMDGQVFELHGKGHRKRWDSTVPWHQLKCVFTEIHLQPLQQQRSQPNQTSPWPPLFQQSSCMLITACSLVQG